MFGDRLNMYLGLVSVCSPDMLQAHIPRNGSIIGDIRPIYFDRKFSTKTSRLRNSVAGIQRTSGIPGAVDDVCNVRSQYAVKERSRKIFVEA